MAGTGGFFLQGVGSGLKSGFDMGQRISEMRWQKSEREKLEKEKEKVMEGVSAFNKRIEEIYADGTISEEENMQLTTMYLASAYEVKERIDGTFKAIQQGRRDISEQNMQWLKFYGESLDGLDPSNIPELFEYTRNQIKGEKGKGLLDAYDDLLKKKFEAAKPMAETFSTAEAVKEKYPKAGYRYDTNARGYVPTFQKQTEETSLTDYNTGLKYLTSIVNVAPENWNRAKKGLETKYGLDYSNVTQESLKEPELAGVKPEPTPAPTSTENIREDILNADTFKDAQRIHDNYAKKYDVSSLGITDLKQEWASGQIEYLNKVKKSIENLLVDRGDKGQWLNNEPVTQETVGLEFKGERPASEIYEMLYKSYVEYLEKLKKLGIDISQFPELLPLSEIEKVGGTEGFFAIHGVKKGDYKSIYK